MKMLVRVFALLGAIGYLSVVHASGGDIPDVREKGWEYPVDYRSHEGCYQFLQYAGHVGVDLCRPAGSTDVRAIADGCVEDFSSTLGSYGGTSGQLGGATLLRHKTASGRVFYAVYGHSTPNEEYLNERRCDGGTKLVEKGDVIATVHPYIGGSDHLHFGIHPDVVDPVKKFRGNSCSDSDGSHCGWVDPFVFLMGEEPGTNDPSTIPGNTFNILQIGNYGWTPANVSCFYAEHWYGLDSERRIRCSYPSNLICQEIYNDIGGDRNLFYGIGPIAPSCHQ